MVKHTKRKTMKKCKRCKKSTRSCKKHTYTCKKGYRSYFKNKKGG